MKNTYLSPWRSFLRGYASVFNIYGHSLDRPDPDRGRERDAEAIADDWRRVGDCLRYAMGQVTTHE